MLWLLLLLRLIRVEVGVVLVLPLLPTWQQLTFGLPKLPCVVVQP